MTEEIRKMLKMSDNELFNLLAKHRPNITEAQIRDPTPEELLDAMTKCTLVLRGWNKDMITIEVENRRRDLKNKEAIDVACGELMKETGDEVAHK